MPIFPPSADPSRGGNLSLTARGNVPAWEWQAEKGPPFLSCGGHRDMAGRSGGYPGSAWRLTVDTSFTPRLADWANAAGHRRHPHLPSSESVWTLTGALVRAPRRAAIPQPAAATPAPADRVVPLSAQMIGLRFTAAAQVAGVESRVTAHSGRVGSERGAGARYL